MKAQAAAAAPGSHRATAPALKPLVLAILSAFPLCGTAQVAVVRPAAPAAFAVPRPMPGWRVSGTGAPAPLNTPNAAGGTNQTVNQSSQRAIYNWQSFDIGANSSVTFNFPTKESSALNRVIGSPTPSQIFGSLKSQYTNPDATKGPLTGGSVYLINANGILFGRNAQVNVGSLIASTLNLKDSDYFSGLTNSITGTTPSFQFEGAPELFSDSRNFVLVDPGAKITTPDGGRVFLFAKNVQNAGTISTPGGQTALAAGAEVYLADPSGEPIYASEVNANFPALRGLLVEVGKGSGTATNLAGGVIDTPRGNTTLVGMAVNQMGRITATTSVSENGSVMLLARGGATADPTVNNVKRASISGALTLGTDSSIAIAPDTTPGSDGLPRTSDGSSAFTTSRVELAGQTVEMKSGAAIVAPGGIVNVRAEVKPNYAVGAVQKGIFNDTAQTARLILGSATRIDVSGTDSASVSAARNFVTTELLGKSDLKDAPLQKDGPLYRSKVTFDLRSAVPILGDTSSYQAAIKRTVDERLSAGGSISLASTGAVVTSQSSRLDVSGGQVTYTEATVTPTRLIAADGTRYTLNQAAADVLYTGIEAASKAPTQDRWGIVPQYAPTQAVSGRLEQGYVAGAAGGSLSIYAPLAVLDGGIAAATTSGQRQTAGIEAQAAAGRVELGARTSGGAFGSRDFRSAGLGGLSIVADPQALPPAFWLAPLTGPLPAESRMAASTLNESGAGKVTVTTDGRIVQQAGADIALGQSAALDLGAAGAGGIVLDGSFSAVGGSFAARAVDLSAAATHGASVSGAVVLEAGRSIDVAGNWSNAFLDGAAALPAVGGGSVSLVAAHGLMLRDSSRIDVSGGANVRATGAVVGTNAGSITLESNNVLDRPGSVPAAVHIGAALKGQSLAGGGTLRVKAADISIGAAPIPRGVADGLTPGSLRLSEAFVRNGGFTSYDIAALRSLRVLSGTTLSPQASNWIATADARNVASGTRPSSFLEEGQLPAAVRRPVSLSLTANAPFAAIPFGDLTLETGTAIVADPLATVNLRAGLNLLVNGGVYAPGGNVNLAMVSASQTTVPMQGSLRLGPTATLDVSGTTVLQPSDGSLARGSVLAGGKVSIASAAASTVGTAIELQPGSVINADGTSGRLLVDAVTAGNATVSRAQTVSSEGGSIAIVASDGGTALAGSMHAPGGDASVAAGKFSLTLNATARDPLLPLPTDIFDRAIKVQEAAVTGTEAVRGVALVSAASLRAGFADVALTAPDHIMFNGSTTLALPRNLVLNAPALQALPGSKVTLSAGSVVQVGSTPNGSGLAPAASGGSASLALKGGLVEFNGAQTLQGFAAVAVDSATELRLNGSVSNGVSSGSLNTLADLQLNAAQVVPSTGTSFTINAPGKRVTIGAGDASAAVPLSAAGAITINAADIVQGGVLRAPFGGINLNATRSLTLGAGSVTSVSGNGLAVPYGSTTGDTAWTYGGAVLAAPAEKTINLLAPGKQIDVKPGALLDLSGGGELLALEFVPGPGGSKDVFADASSGAFAVIPALEAYAPQDRDLQALAGNSAATTSLGTQVTFGSGGPIPAGTYAVLPARYATLAGAYLVTPTQTAAPFDLGASVAKPDGSFIVGARLGAAGTAYTGTLPASFKVMSSAVARQRSEIHETSADAYFAQQATAAGAPLPRLPFDAGRLNIVADALSLKGSYDFGHPADALARGGELDISAARIRVGGSAPVESGVLSLQAADLNATGASLVVLGGQRGGPTGEALAVNATEVVIDNGAEALKVADLVLAATGRVELEAGARIESAGSASSQALTVSGDGALLRVSGDGSASTLRTNVSRATGDLQIGSGAALKAASITAEGTHSASVAADATLAASDSLTLGASRMAIGAAAPGAVAATTLQLTPSLLAQIGQTDALTLRSFDGIDFYGSSTLGQATLRSLTLDTASLRMAEPGAAATVRAGGVGLSNTSGASAGVVVGTGRLGIEATGGAGGSGQIVIGPGSVAASGAASVALNAANEVVLNGAAQFSASGDVTLDSAALIATRAASASLNAGGKVVIESNGNSLAAAGGSGAHVVISAQGIEQRGTVVLPSGDLTLATAGGNAGPAIAFRPGSLTDLSGRATAFDGVTVATPGGDLRISTRSGEVVFDAGSTVDVSAPAVAGQAGSITIAAPTGGVELSGRLRATSALAQGGGALSVDSDRPLDLARLAATLQAERTATVGNFAQSLDLRNRRGDQTLPNGGPGLAAQQIALSSDAGSLTIAGRLDAGTGADPSITLAAGQTLTIAPGAQLEAHATGASGATVQLMAGVSGAGGEAPNGRIALLGGSIDVSAAPKGSDGSVLLRAQLTDAGNDVRIDGIATQITGAQRIEAEAVRTYAATVVDADLIARVEADNDAFAGTDGASALAIRGRLSNGNAALLDKLQLRAGVEIVSKGDLRVEGDGASNGWNLTRFDEVGAALPQPSGAPMNLTLRAAGTLNVAASLSDGFLPAGDFVPDSAYAAKQIVPGAVILPGEGASIALVGGADLQAANVMTTVHGDTAGDVSIGASNQDVLVRTTTGRVQVAAGRDVKLLNRSAVVYTTGVPVGSDDLTGYVGNQLPEPGANYLINGENIQNPFLQRGGSVAVAAGRDLVGATDSPSQYVAEWLWTSGDLGTNTGAPLWRSRYDMFKQGFATFGGGSVTAAAGRDARGVEIATATSGYVARDGDGASADTHVFGGGSATLVTQRDVIGGFVLAGQGAEIVRAGRDLVSTTALAPLQVVYGATQTRISARNAVDVGRVTAFGMVETTKQAFDTSNPLVIAGLTEGASLLVQADSGDLLYRASTPLAPGHRAVDTVQTKIIPERATFAAPMGNATIGQIVQVPSADGQLALLAGSDLSTGAVTVTGTKTAQQSPTLLSNTADVVALAQAFPAGAPALDASGRDAVRLVALDGDIDYAGNVWIARPLRMIAGRDIVASGGGQGSVQIQHQDATELSLLQAGRDILLPLSNSNSGEDLKLHGPGNLVVVAGRDIDLRTSGGIGTLGNRELAQLPQGSATLTVLAGVRLNGSDFAQAARWYFPLLGGTGIAGYAADLAAQLAALKSGAALPALGGAAAQAFGSSSVADKIVQTQAVAGSAVFDAALLSFVQRRESKPALSLDAARTLFDAYSSTDKETVIAAALANAWAAQVPRAQQLDQVLAMAAVQGKDGTHADALTTFVQAQSGSTGLTTAQVLEAFAALPVERQLVFTGQVLTAEVRAAGRAASPLAGTERDTAYAKAYAAIDVVFPELGAAGDLQMGSSQLRTFQGSGIQVFTPRGGINVGQLSAQSSSKSAGVLGIVTAAGGDIDLIVRDSVAVNQSRVFTVGQGDLLMWASEGNLDAGRGAKTVTGAPPPVFKFDANGNFVIDTSGSFTGSGIAVLDAGSTLDLYAPKGEINAGDAGIKSLGNAFLGAARFVGADNLSVGGVAVGAPPPAPTGGETAGLASLGQAATSAGTRINPEDSDEEKERKRRKRLNLILDFLGFGDGSTQP